MKMQTYFETGNNGDCCGCEACVQVCPVGCISMEENYEGFFYPEIDNTKCIKCNKCREVCPFNSELLYDICHEPVEEYAAYTNSEEYIRDSSSGGIFCMLALWIIDKGGSVYGASFDKKNNLMHRRVDNIGDLKKILGSKYIQSRINDIYIKVKQDLIEDKLVLFAGTPCQVAGLNLFLGKKYDNLYTTDFICHGVPSQLMFDKYVEYLEEKNKGKLTKVIFRDKSKYGWSITLRYDIDTKGKKGTPFVIPKLKHIKEQPSLYIKKRGLNTFILPRTFSAYFSGFLAGMLQRESCYSCKYASMNRPSDITMGDFWGYQKTLPEIENELGISLILINSDKGREILKEIDDKIWKKKLTKKQAYTDENYNLRRPTTRPDIRDRIYNDLKERGFEYIAKKNMRPADYYRQLAKYTIPKRWHKFFKKN